MEPRLKSAKILLAIRLTVVLAVLAITASPAWSWGNKAHRLVAKVAERHLTDEARNGVRDLLDPDEDMATASTWADEQKRQIKGSAPWHYVNVPIDEEKYKAEFCDNCVVAKIQEFRDILKDRTQSRSRRQVALRFVIHLVGDVHQPLHVGDNNDRGGNDTQVRFFNKGSNLHKVWDTDMIEWVGRNEDQWLQTLAQLDTEDNQKKCMKDGVENWATESLVAAKQAYQMPGCDRLIKSGDKLRNEYLDANLPTVRRRLYQAGLRLALVLNDAFTR
jgi:nuclease S1